MLRNKVRYPIIFLHNFTEILIVKNHAMCVPLEKFCEKRRGPDEPTCILKCCKILYVFEHKEIVTAQAGSYIAMKERIDKLIAEEDAATKKSEEEFARRFREKARKKKKKLRAKANAGESSV